MKRLSLGALLMVAFAVAITASPKNAPGVTYTFLQLEPAGDPAAPHYPVTGGPSATGINNLNQIVGHNNGFHGVFYSPSGGVLSTFRAPGQAFPGPPPIVLPAPWTVAFKINDHGTVIGMKGGPTSTWEAFVMNAAGIFTPITPPSEEFATLLSGLGINNHGDVVGEVWPGGVSWLLSGGTATLINGISSTTAITDINDFGHHVGRYGAAGWHGYLQTGPTMADVTNVDHPLAGPGQTYPMGLNNRGQVVGYYYNTTDVYPVFQNGFLWEAGVFTPLDYQGLNQAGFSGRNTVPYDINDAGWVVGATGETSTDTSFLGGGHAWLAIPDSPGAEASNPILPDSVGAGGVFSFANVGTGQWFDPPATVAGYTYTMTGGELFTGILGFPSGFVTSVSTGTVLGNGTVSFGSGVSSFTVTSSPTVELGDSDAFPLQLSFSAPTASFTMTPVGLASAPSDLIATGRTDTKLYVQWQPSGNTMFTLDYLGPEYFGGVQPTCNDFPPHNNIHETSSHVEVIEGLQSSTWYFIHVHAIDPATHLVIDGSTNVIIVKTGVAGSGVESLAPGSSGYIICGGDGGGGDDDAGLTLTLAPGSVIFPSVQVSVTTNGEAEETYTLPFNQLIDAGAGSHRLLFAAPAGYSVTPAQVDLQLLATDSASVALFFAAIDTTPPVLTLPSNVVVDATSPAGATVLFDVSATDLVDGTRPVDCTPASGAVFVIGLTTVNCTTADTQGNSGNGGFTVTVRSAAQIVSDLSALATSFAFKEGSKLLQNALTSIGSGDISTACGQLGAFIKQVQAQAGKKITIAQAAALIAAANKAKAALGCS